MTITTPSVLALDATAINDQLLAELEEQPFEFAEMTAPDLADSATLQERFEAFHVLNPHVYDRLRARALHLVENGRKHFGIKMLWEVLRYDLLVTYGDSFKLNNDYTSRYARLLMESEPRLDGVFTLRELRA